MSDKIIFNGREYADCIHTTTKVKLSLKARLEIIFGSHIEICEEVYCENLPGCTGAKLNIHTYTIIDKIRAYFRRNKGYMEAPQQETI